jgi:ketosteroid isomerase-like protein
MDGLAAERHPLAAQAAGRARFAPMREYRLKRWQRILIVLSVFWMAFGAVWGWRHANDRVDAEFKQCLTQIKKAADVQACRAQRASALVPQWFGAAVAATLPVALFWLCLYALIFLARRIRRPAGSEPEFANGPAPPPRVSIDAPSPEPTITGRVPAAIASGPVAIGAQPGSQARPVSSLPPSASDAGKSANKRTVENYLEGFRRSDHQAILSCLTDDIEWVLPGMFHIEGKAAFDREIENPAFVGSPEITVTRVMEQGDVVVAEGRVRAAKRDGGMLDAVFCDVFELRDAKIKRLVSYLMELKSP